MQTGWKAYSGNPLPSGAAGAKHLGLVPVTLKYCVLDVIFKIISKGYEFQGNCYESYFIEDGDLIDIISTNKSVFGYLAIRSYLKLPISFPSTTRCKKAISGGDILQNF